MSGDPETVHAAGISVRGRVGACESHVPDDQLENWIVNWPGKVPKAAAKPAASDAKKRAGAKAQPVASDARKRAGKPVVAAKTGVEVKKAAETLRAKSKPRA